LDSSVAEYPLWDEGREALGDRLRHRAFEQDDGPRDEVALVERCEDAGLRPGRRDQAGKARSQGRIRGGPEGRLRNGTAQATTGADVGAPTDDVSDDTGTSQPTDTVTTADGSWDRNSASYRARCRDLYNEWQASRGADGVNGAPDGSPGADAIVEYGQML
jgi:hypothetical protein